MGVLIVLISPHERVMIRALSCFSWDKVCSTEEHLKCRRVLTLYLGYSITKCRNNDETLMEANKFLDSNGLFNIVELVKARNQFLAVRAALWFNRDVDLHCYPSSCNAFLSAYQF